MQPVQDLLWNIPASLSYGGIFYSKLMRYYDGFMLGKADEAGFLPGAVVYDIGAGRANYAFEAIKCGARAAYVIETSDKHVEHIERRKARIIRRAEIIKKGLHLDADIFANIHVIQEDMYGDVVTDLALEQRPDIIHFKRCLYDERIKSLLTKAYEALNPGGIMYIVHPEKDKRLYIDDGDGGFAFDHWAKWEVNRIGDLSKRHLHINYARKKLEEIVDKACPKSFIRFLPASRPAYHFMIVRKPGRNQGVMNNPRIIRLKKLEFI